MPDLTTERLAELRSTAAIAEGWWDGYTWQPRPNVIARADTTVARAEHPTIADHIAAFDPPTVLALLDEVQRLRRWKTEALPMISGLQELGRVLDVGIGKQITGPEGVEAAKVLVAELEASRAALNRIADLWTAGRAASGGAPGATVDLDSLARAMGGA